jgi:sugar phosphate isomerase/epimerase
MRVSRRAVLAGFGGAVLCDAATGVPGPLGLELYSLRREISKDVPGTLALTRKLGFSEVEVPQLYGLSPRRFRAELDKAGLRCTAFVTPDASLRADLVSTAETAHTLGAEYMIYPWINHGPSGFTRDDCLRAAADFNRWGEQFKAARLQFCYHPHGYEFGASAEGTLLDTLIRQTHPGLVQYQMDVFWIAWPGQNPVQLLNRYPDRFPLMHLKDLKRGVTGSQTGQAPEEVSVALGSGSIDFPSVLKAAEKAGVKRFYIEDESPLAAQQIPQSLRYLDSLKVSG